jgi:hypothetical protein
MIELRCSRDLALRLGCIEPNDAQHHRDLRKAGSCMLVRDPTTLAPMFWPLVTAAAVQRSS